MIEAIIFDIDGTLLDSEDANVASYQRIFQRAGYLIPSRDAIISLLHLTKHDTIGALASGMPIGKIDALREFARGVAYPVELLRVFPYSQEAVVSLSEKYKLGLASNRLKKSIDTYFTVSGLEDYFSVVVGADDVIHPKPSPEPLLKALNLLDVLPNNAVYVGDTSVDLQAARAAGMKVVLHRSSFPGADDYFSSYQDFEQLIKRSEEHKA